MSVPRVIVLAAASLALAGCGAASTGDTGGRLRVVAAENMWGSIAAQLGGGRVEVTNIVKNPAADPHDYEPTPADARILATAQLAILNGVGYDPWASKLLSANPTSGRLVLSAGNVVAARAGANPHLWYSPADVQRVIGAIVADYKRLDPRHASYYDAQEKRFESKGLARYRALIAAIAQRYAGVPVGASESILAPLAQSLGLKLLTPSGLLNAVSEGSDPTAADRSTADRQIARHEIKVWIYNSQNATPDVQRLTAEARARGIPVTTVSETLTPASASFQQWQVSELEALSHALRVATGR